MESAKRPVPAMDPERLRSLERSLLLEDKETLSECIDSLCVLQNLCNGYQRKLEANSIDYVTGWEDETIVSLCSRLVTMRYRVEDELSSL